MRAKEKFKFIAHQFKKFADANKYNFTQEGFNITVNLDILDEYEKSYSMALYPDNKFVFGIGNAILFIPSRQIKKFLIEKEVIKINDITLMEK